MLEKNLDDTDATTNPQEAAYRRIQSQEWVGSAIDDLTAAIGELYTTVVSPPDANRAGPSIESLGSSILAHCDHISLAAQVAAGHAAVCASESREWGQELENVEAEIKKEEAVVAQLRETLQEEKMLAERRAQYAALVGVIMKEPSVEDSKTRLKHATRELEKVEKEIDVIETAKRGISQDVHLFLHSASSLQSFSDKICELLEEKEEGEAGAMDTSS